MKNTFARNRIVAMNKASKVTGVPVDVIKAAYKSKTKSDDETINKAVNMVHGILRAYGKKYRAEQAGAEAAPVAEAVAE